MGKEIVVNDVNKKRIETLKLNLDRLKLKSKIMNYDILKMSLKEKYDFIILDAPCSSLGTIRRNPELYFKTKEPNFIKITKLQENLLNTASELINPGGVILYMVCSFLKTETKDQIANFLKKNNEFILDEFSLSKNNEYYNKFVKNKMFLTLPTRINGKNIDGYFAACLKKINK